LQEHPRVDQPRRQSHGRRRRPRHPVDIHPKVGKPTLEVVLTTVGAGAKFDKRTTRPVPVCTAIGAKAVTALSEWAEARVYRNGKVYVQNTSAAWRPRRQELGAAKGNRTGTDVTFMPDPEVMDPRATFDYDTLETRPARARVPQQGPDHQAQRQAHEQGGYVSYAGGVAQFRRVPQPHEEPSTRSSMSTRRWTTSE